MTQNSPYVVQYVGFKTNINASDFISRWIPFALGFKNAGAKTIDLYQVHNNETLTFISRNVWDIKTYFQNFPSGIAGAGGGGGISVTQLGGFWLQDDQLQKQHEMKLAFLSSGKEESNTFQISRLNCIENGNYKLVLDILPKAETNFQNEIYCNHLKTI